MIEHELLRALFGGILIGCAAMILLYGSGRIAGISGIVGGVLEGGNGIERSWRIAFIVGMLGAGLAWWFTQQTAPAGVIFASWPLIVCGGLLVGFGTRLGAGCTSGHGVCGIARFSARSIVATCTFMLVAGITVFVSRHVLVG